MKKSGSPIPRVRARKAPEPSVPRYQVYRQMRQGVFAAELRTDSASEVVAAFLDRAPAFKGGEVRIWNHSEQRVVATVQWDVGETRRGGLVHRRRNVFFDLLLERIARQAGKRLKPTRKASARPARTTRVSSR